MTKLLGAVLVITASAGIGYMTGLDYQKYLEELRYLKMIMLQIKGEIGYTRGALFEVTGRTARRIREPYSSWLSNMSKVLEARSENSFSRIWTSCIETDLKQTRLKKEDIEDLKQMGVNLGYLDTSMQLGMLELYMERLELKIQQVQSDVASKRRVWNCLGVLFGMFVTIMLV